MAHPQHEAVRRRYGYRCGYCGVSEVDAGGELTVDHYHPVSAHGDDSDENLVYACMRCNLHKSDYWPDDEALAAGRRVLHPLREDSTLHLREREDGTLEALSDTGRFHIGLLQLNREPLVLHRERRRSMAAQAALHRLLLVLIEAQRQSIAEMRSYIASLTNRELSEEDDV